MIRLAAADESANGPNNKHMERVWTEANARFGDSMGIQTNRHLSLSSLDCAFLFWGRLISIQAIKEQVAEISHAHTHTHTHTHTHSPGFSHYSSVLVNVTERPDLACGLQFLEFEAPCWLSARAGQQ